MLSQHTQHYGRIKFRLGDKSFEINFCWVHIDHTPQRPPPPTSGIKVKKRRTTKKHHQLKYRNWDKRVEAKQQRAHSAREKKNTVKLKADTVINVFLLKNVVD
jgi:hypothetical protein